MAFSHSVAVFLLLAATGVGAGCRTAGQSSAPEVNPGPPGDEPQMVQPGRPGEASKVIPAEASARSAALPHTPGDTKFMQGMIGHHHARRSRWRRSSTATATSEDMKLLAKRIEVSQIDEISMMKGWLTARRETLPDEHAHHAGDHALMPGMLTQAEMTAAGGGQG